MSTWTGWACGVMAAEDGGLCPAISARLATEMPSYWQSVSLALWTST